MGLMLFINPMLPFSSEGQTLAVTFHTIRDRRIVALLLKSYYAAESLPSALFDYLFRRLFMIHSARASLLAAINAN